MAELKNFEKNMKRLEKLAEILENGELTLEKSLSAYSEAALLIKECSDALNEAESRIKILECQNITNPPVIDNFTDDSEQI